MEGQCVTTKSASEMEQLMASIGSIVEMIGNRTRRIESVMVGPKPEIGKGILPPPTPPIGRLDQARAIHQEAEECLKRLDEILMLV